MPLNTEIPELPSLNLTPMIDILLVLIMFFLFASRLSESEQAQRQEIDVELPTASPVATMSRRPDALMISVDKFGRIVFRDRELSLEQLQTELQAAKNNYAEQAVLISGDREGQYQSVVDVLDICRLCQINHLSLAYRPQGTPIP